MRVEWRGRAVTAKVLAAEVAATDEVTHAAAESARTDHWWQSESGRLERETVAEPARVLPGGAVAGKMGSTSRMGFYGLILEYEQPWLRPAADREYPKLSAVIAGNLAAGR